MEVMRKEKEVSWEQLHTFNVDVGLYGFLARNLAIGSFFLKWKNFKPGIKICYLQFNYYLIKIYLTVSKKHLCS